MKKLIVLSLMSMAMFIPQIYSISVAEYIKQNGVPALENGYHSNFINLSGKNLTDLEGLQNIPDAIRNQIRVLDLSNNQLQALPAGIFNGLNNLQRLSLGYNQIQTLPAGIFNGLNNLNYLYLRGNSLRTLPADIFNGLHNLTGLYLANNRLQTLPRGIFNGLHNLYNLDLQGNPLSAEFLLTLPAIIKGTPTLHKLDYKPVDEALKFYRVYQPKTLQEITKEYAMQNLTPEDLEEVAETNFAAFDLLLLAAQQKAAIIAKNIDMYRNQLYKLSQEVLDLLPLTPQQRAGIEAQKRQMGRP